MTDRERLLAELRALGIEPVPAIAPPKIEPNHTNVPLDPDEILFVFEGTTADEEEE